MEAATYIKLLETQLREFITRCGELVEIVERQAAEITALKARIVELEARLNKNSSNNHKPPSLDGFKSNRSYISTSKKQGWNIMEALETAIQGQPFLCNASEGC